MTRKHYKIDKVVLGDETKIEGTTLYVRKAAATEGAEAQKLVHSLELDVSSQSLQRKTMQSSVKALQESSTE